MCFFLAAVARRRGRSRQQIGSWNELHVHFILPYFILMSSPIRSVTLCWKVRGTKNRSFVCNVTVPLFKWTRFAGNQVRTKWGEFCVLTVKLSTLERTSHRVLQSNTKVTTTKREASFNFIPTFLYIQWGMRQRTMLQRTVLISKIMMLQRTRRNSYRPTWHARAHDVSDLPALIRASVIIFIIVCMVQLSAYLYSVWELNELILYYLYTYILDFALYFSCLNCFVGL